MKLLVLVGVVCCVELAGCATVSFAPPPDANLTTSSTTVATAISKANGRLKDFIEASDQIANAPQVFDLSTMGAGLAAIAASAFGAPSSYEKGAAIAAAGLVAGRTYYAFNTRQAAFLVAAGGENCVAGAGRGILQIDGKQDAWRASASWAAMVVQTFPSDPVATKILQLEPIVLGAPEQLDSAELGIEIGLRKKLSVPSPPDLSAIATTYQSALQQAQGSGQSNAAASAAAKAVAPVPGGHGAVAPTEEQQAAALLADPALLNNLSSLSTTLTACVALVS